MCKHFIGISLLASIYHHCFHELSPFVGNQPSSFSPCRLCLIGGAYGTSSFSFNRKNWVYYNNACDANMLIECMNVT